MSSNIMNNEFDFIIKARNEAKRFVQFYKSLLSKADSIDLTINEFKGDKKLRKLAALDGGEGKEDLLAASILIVRGGGGIFEINKKIKKYILYDVCITTLNKDIDELKSLIRDIMEFKIALHLLDENPEVLIMDGSLSGYYKRGLPKKVLGYIDKTSITDLFIKEYLNKFKEYIKLYDRILRICRKKDILLMGVSKDSYVSYLVNKLNLSENITDYSFLKLKMRRKGYLDPIEIPATIESETLHHFYNMHNVYQKDIAEFMLSYFKLDPRKNPIRVDFPKWQYDRFDEIISVMETYHDHKGFLMTAHLVHNWAKMEKHIVSSAVNAIKQEILKLDPQIYDTVFAPKTREGI